jgi:5-methylcytosine-specific restriction endonuclease McrA
MREVSDLYHEKFDPIRFPSPSKRPAITSKQRWTVWKRDNFTCLKCGVRENLSVDHIEPLCLGGEHHERNMQTLCLTCNIKKGGRRQKTETT